MVAIQVVVGWLPNNRRVLHGINMREQDRFSGFHSTGPNWSCAFGRVLLGRAGGLQLPAGQIWACAISQYGKAWVGKMAAHGIAKKK
jgi:hypothetical protein